MTSPENRETEEIVQRPERIRLVVEDYQRRRAAGEPVAEDSVTSQYSDLMPELGDALRKARLIGDAAEEALQAEWSSAQRQMDEDTLCFQPGRDEGPGPEEGERRSSPETVGSDDGAPDRIGKYVVVELLDRGGQTDVYRAVDTMLKRDVVIKLNRDPSAASRSAREVLIQQGRLVAQLEHPNLDRVYDVGFHGECPYLVMEYERGLNLSQHVKQQSMTAAQKAALIAQVARAVCAAHSQGIVHRDIKPENIMVGKDRQPKLIDFGMAWLRDAWTSGPAEIGLVSGTPEYMAPEQARGESVDQRSDVFALGAVLYYLLIGNAPFATANRTEALKRARECDFDAACLRSPGVPGALRRICVRAMQPVATDRYRTADDMAGDLERYAGSSRRWVYAACGLAAVLLLTAAVVWSLVSTGEKVAQVSPEVPRPQPDQPSGLSLPPPNLPPEETERPLQILVWQDNQAYDIHDAVPLRSGDDVQITWKLPEGLFGTLFWFDTEGQLHELGKIETDQNDAAANLVWPEPGKSSVLAGPSGTEVIFLCANSLRCPTADDVRAIVDEGGPWPELSGKSFIEFGRQGVEVRGPRFRGPGDELRDRAEGRVRERADTLIEQLPEGFEVLRGLAFPHVEP